MASLASPSTLPSSAQVATARGMCGRQRDLVATPVAKAVTTAPQATATTRDGPGTGRRSNNSNHRCRRANRSTSTPSSVPHAAGFVPARLSPDSASRQSHRVELGTAVEVCLRCPPGAADRRTPGPVRLPGRRRAQRCGAFRRGGDDGDLRDPVILQGNLDPPVRIAPAEEAGAIDRVEVPDTVGLTEATKFLAEQDIVRSSLGQRLAKQSLDRPVGFGDRRAVRLQRRTDAAPRSERGQASTSRSRRRRPSWRSSSTSSYRLICRRDGHRHSGERNLVDVHETSSICFPQQASKGISPSRWLGAAIRPGCSAAPVTRGAASGGRRAPAPSGTWRQRMTARICRMRIWR